MEYVQTIALFYPEELVNHTILKENISNISSNLPKWIRANKIFKKEERVMKSLYFDSEINKQKEILGGAELQLEKAEYELNKGISPYKWKIIERFDNYVGGRNVRADYALFLEGK